MAAQDWIAEFLSQWVAKPDHPPKRAPGTLDPFAHVADDLEKYLQDRGYMIAPGWIADEQEGS